MALSLFIIGSTAGVVANSLLAGLLPSLGEESPLVWISLATLLVVLAYPPVDMAYSWLFRQVLFPRRSHALQLLNHLTEDLAQASDLTELANLLVNTLGEAFGFKVVSLLVKGCEGEGFVVASAYGWNVADYRKLRLAPTTSLLELMRASGPQVLLRERVVRSLSWQEANQLTQDFEALHATCVIPLWSKKELIGSVNLLTRSEKGSLEEGDLRFFRDFGQQVAPSVVSALAIQQLKLWNEELKDRQSKALQSAKLKAIEQLAAGIAHEIHNPLTIISGKAQVLLLQKDRKSYDEKVEEVLKTIVKQTRRAADITRKLVMFSKATVSPEEKLRLDEVLEDTISLLSHQTSLEGIEIQKRFADELPDFFGNVQEIREIFLNLILNALQAVGAKGRIEVGITFNRSEQVFVVQVADTGPGIPLDNLDKIFNPFFTTQPEGVGLGLFVTQQIVHRYGGSIRAESQPGEGTLFIIELPMKMAAKENSSAPSVAAMEGVEIHDSTVGGG